MARQQPTSPGGIALSIEILSAINANISDMKTNGANRNADVNATIGNEDLANAIAIAIEKVFGSAAMTAPGAAANLFYLTPTAVPAPVTGSINLALANPKYVFTGA